MQYSIMPYKIQNNFYSIELKYDNQSLLLTIFDTYWFEDIADLLLSIFNDNV